MKQKKSGPLQAHVIYLLVLLLLVLLYVIFAFPQLSLLTTTLETQYNMFNTQNNMLAQYEPRLGELAQEIRAAQDAYETDTSLRAPASFTNLISAAADSAGVTLDSVSVQAEPEVYLGGNVGQAHTAVIQASIPVGVAPERFLQALETVDGAGLYVKSIAYQPVQAAQEGDALPDEAAHSCTVTVTCYTLSK